MVEHISFLFICIGILGVLGILVLYGTEIRRAIRYHRMMKRTNQALESRKLWIVLDQRETRDKLIRDWEELDIPSLNKDYRI